MKSNHEDHEEHKDKNLISSSYFFVNFVPFVVKQGFLINASNSLLKR